MAKISLLKNVAVSFPAGGRLTLRWQIAVPFTLIANKMGFNTLADLQMLGLEYQHTALATTRRLIKSRPHLVRNVIKAYVEGIHYYKTHRSEGLATLRKYLKTDDTEALTETYEAVGLTLLPEKPYPTLKGIDVMLRELGGKDPKAQTARPEQFVDMTFVKELDSSGFIDRLYKPMVASRKEALPVPPKEDTKEEAAKSKLTDMSPAKAKTIRTSLAQEYTVKGGDTLSKLALHYYGNWRNGLRFMRLTGTV